MAANYHGLPNVRSRIGCERVYKFTLWFRFSTASQSQLNGKLHRKKGPGVFRLALLFLVTNAADMPVLALVRPPATDAPSTTRAAIDTLLAAAKSGMLIDPAAAGRSAQAAEALARKLPLSRAGTISLATAFWLQAESLERRNQAAAAVSLVDAGIKSVSDIRPAVKLQGDLLQTRAGIEDSLGQPMAALDDYQRSYSLFGQVGATRNQAVALQNMGLLYLEANDLDRVSYYYKLAEETFPNDPMLNLSGSANQAQALFLAKRYSEAEVRYQRAYAIAVVLNNPILQVQMLSNVTRMQAALGKLHEADATLARAIKLWRPSQSPEMASLLLETRAVLAVDENRPAEAVRFIEQAFALIGDAAVTQPYWQLQFTAYKAYAQAGNPAKALAHFEIYQKLDNRSRALAASTSGALSAARFNFASQNERIATLKAGQLERDVTLAHLQARQKLILLGALLLIASSILVGLVIYLRSLRLSRKAIQEINAQLTKVNIELNTALAAKTDFLATTSHEIRTPLNGILGMTQVLLADPMLTGDVRERINLMQGAGEMLRALVDDILDFAKMDNRKLELHPLETDLPKLLDDVVNFWRDRAGQEKLTLTLDRTDVPDRITIDSRRLRQIVTNLLSNSIKFTSEGSVKLTATTVQCSSKDGPEQSSERLRIAVTDTGIGIAETDYETVFDRFRQLDSSTTRRFTGTGLGLAISRMIAQAMGGDIELVSMVEVGSTFTVDLPMVRTAAAVSATGKRPSTLAAAGLVLIGANPITQGVLRAVLAPHVANFAVAADIPTAVEKIPAHLVDLIVIDMPKPIDTETESDLEVRIAGIVATAKVASDAGIIVTVLWPNQQLAEHARLLAAGVAAVVGKPVTSSALLQKLTPLFDETHDGAYN